MKVLRIALVLLSFVALSHCGDDKSSTPNTPETDSASGTVSSTQSGHFETPAGAYIDIPAGAVPLTLDSTVGTMIFSVEKVTQSVEVHNPNGLTRIGDIYQFGPEGFIFETPVQIAVPVEGDYEVGEVLLARIDPMTRVPQVMSADYDPEEGVIRAWTDELSEWETLVNNVSQAEDHAWARIQLSADFETGFEESTEYAVVCPQSFSVTYPEDSLLGTNVVYAGVDRPQMWTVPQGTYTFCIEFAAVHGLGGRSFRKMLVPNVTIVNTGGFAQDTDYTITITQAQYDNAEAIGNDRCDCKRKPTPATGTGELQVTLTWFNDRPLDLDLWVTDPAGEKCYYANTPSSSGGELDRDNLCGTYENGKPENIFWVDAANGDYLVDVDWYYDCGDSLLEAQAYSVRIAGNFAPITKTGVVLRDQTVRVGKFTLSGNQLAKWSLEPEVLERSSLAKRKAK